MPTLEVLPLATTVAVVILGGPLTLIVLIRGLSFFLGNIWVKPVATGDEEAPLGLKIQWDNETYDYKVSRVRLEYYEIFRGGRSLSTSFTFEDKQAKKRAFVLPLKLVENELKILTQSGSTKELKNSHITVEVESVDGRTVRRKLSKAAVIKALNSAAYDAKKAGLDLVPPKESDAWSVHSRVFPWRKVVEAEETKKAAGPSSAGPSTPQSFDYTITKVWIEPGCIVCDACENEAPDVFEVLEDTCIVRDNAPLVDTGSIVAAAEGCPVDVIKYDTAPKSA